MEEYSQGLETHTQLLVTSGDELETIADSVAIKSIPVSDRLAEKLPSTLQAQYLTKEATPNPWRFSLLLEAVEKGVGGGGGGKPVY